VKYLQRPPTTNNPINKYCTGFHPINKYQLLLPQRELSFLLVKQTGRIPSPDDNICKDIQNLGSCIRVHQNCFCLSCVSLAIFFTQLRASMISSNEIVVLYFHFFTYISTFHTFYHIMILIFLNLFIYFFMCMLYMLFMYARQVCVLFS